MQSSPSLPLLSQAAVSRGGIYSCRGTRALRTIGMSIATRVHRHVGSFFGLDTGGCIPMSEANDGHDMNDLLPPHYVIFYYMNELVASC